jgi:hypothetical protein
MRISIGESSQELMKSKEHLTIEGLAKIEEIKSNTNTKRIYLVSNSTTPHPTPRMRSTGCVGGPGEVDLRYLF